MFFEGKKKKRLKSCFFIFFFRHPPPLSPLPHGDLALDTVVRRGGQR